MSAIAARKARLAAQNASLPDEISAQLVSPSPSPSPKRKETGAGVPRGNGANAKRRRSQQKPSRSDASQSNYFEKQPESHPYSSSNGAERSHLVDEVGGGSGSSDESSDADSDLEEELQPEKFVAGTDLPSDHLIVSVKGDYVPLKDGNRKNWHFVSLSATSASTSTGPKSEQALIVGLAPGEKLAFVGKAFVQVLSGSCDAAGAKLFPQQRPVLFVAPQSSPLPLIESERGMGFCPPHPEYGLSGDRFAAILKITSADSTGIDGITKACPLLRPAAFAGPGTTTTMEGAPRGFHLVSGPAKGLTAWQAPASWLRALNAIATISDRSTTSLVRGPKRVGKSTFARFLLHRLVSTHAESVAFLDTDIGQTEFGPPGVVALHIFPSLRSDAKSSSGLIVGPSWATIRTPYRSHFLGDTTPRDDPAIYLESVADLLRCYEADFRGKATPLIVNTQGWVKGLGADLLSQLEQMVQPSHIFDISKNDEMEMPAGRMEVANPAHTQVFPLESISPALTRDRGLNAVEARTLTLVSYFYSVNMPSWDSSSEPESKQWPRWDFAESLLQHQPYIVSIPQGLPAGLHVLPRASTVDELLQLSALNGSCVALVSVDEPTRIAEEQTAEPRRAVGPWQRALRRSSSALSPRCSHFVALAIVRSIDVGNAALHLLSPISPAQLAGGDGGAGPDRQLCLVKGAIEVPVWLSLNFAAIEATQQTGQRKGASNLSAPTDLEGVAFAEVPYLDFDAQSNAEADSERHIVGMGKRKVRRNILRRSQKPLP